MESVWIFKLGLRILMKSISNTKQSHLFWHFYKLWIGFLSKDCYCRELLKVYSLCKMVSLGQKLKMPKTCKKPFETNIGVVLCKKPLAKTPNIREMRRFLKSAILQRLESMPRVYLLQNGHFGSKIKNTKIMQKTILQEH